MSDDSVGEAERPLLSGAPPDDLVALVGDADAGRRLSPIEVRDAWRHVVAGRWTLVGHVETDDRRYLLASHAKPPGRRARGLTRAERSAAALAASGASGKQIALAMGVGPSRVSRLLRAAAAQLGLPHPVIIPRLLAALAGAGEPGTRPSPPHPTELWLATTRGAETAATVLVEPLAPGTACLTRAEAEVARLLVEGTSYDAIAGRRGVSPRTVGNQAGAIYRKLRLRGREELAWLAGRTRGGAAAL